MYYSSIPSCVIMDTLWTCIIVVYLVVWTHYGHIMDMYYSSIPSCDTLRTLWTRHYGHIMDMYYSSIPSCVIMDTWTWTVVSLWTHYGHVL